MQKLLEWFERFLLERATAARLALPDQEGGPAQMFEPDLGECADCANCTVGPIAIYAPTLAERPEAVCAARAQVLHFRAHQIIKRADEPIDWVYTLRQGWACRSVQFPDGRRQILSFLLPGDTINFEAICVESYAASYAVRALTDVTLCAFRPAALHEITSADSYQRQFSARYMLGQKEAAERRLADIGRRRALGSLSQLILELYILLRHRGLARANSASFPLRQEDLADALGLTPAHVNRTLLELKRRAILEIRRGELLIHDLDHLQAIAMQN
jgi:CRP-like cAMP-binding protein